MVNASAVVAGRDFGVKTAPFAASPGNAIPADTVSYGGSWGGSWVDAGYTRNGLSVSINIPRSDINVDQELDPVMRIATGRDMRLMTDLAEMTVANIAAASGVGVASTTAPSTGVRGRNKLEIGSSVTEQFTAVGFDILTPGDGEAFRIAAYKTLAVGTVNLAFRPTEAATAHLEAACLPDTTASPTRIMTIVDVIAAT